MPEMDEIYLLNFNRTRVDQITGIISLVWTERYKQSGDFTLVMDPINNPLYRPILGSLQGGWYLENSASDYLMQIYTVERGVDQDGHQILTLSGHSWEKRLEDRFVAADVNFPFEPFVTTNRPLRIASRIVERTIVEGVLGQTDVVEDFSVAQASAAGEIQTNEYDYDNLYTSVQEVTDVVEGGFRVYMDKTDRSLEFLAYTGVDRTNTVFFSSDIGNLVVERSLETLDNFKNTAIMVTQNGPVTIAGRESHVKRPIVIDAKDYNNQQMDALRRIAHDELRKHKYQSLVEGEVYDGVNYRYKQHYNLGDIVSVTNQHGIVSESRVVEYVRTYERTGSKAFPTFEYVDRGGD